MPHLFCVFTDLYNLEGGKLIMMEGWLKAPHNPDKFVSLHNRSLLWSVSSSRWSSCFLRMEKKEAIIILYQHIIFYSWLCKFLNIQQKTAWLIPSIALTCAFLWLLLKKSGSSAAFYQSVGNVLKVRDGIRHPSYALRRYNSRDQSCWPSQDMVFSLPLPSTLCYLDHWILCFWLWYDSVQTWSAHIMQLQWISLCSKDKWEIIVALLMSVFQHSLCVSVVCPCCLISTAWRVK